MLRSSRKSVVGVALMLLAACTSHPAVGDPVPYPLDPRTAPALHATNTWTGRERMRHRR